MGASAKRKKEKKQDFQKPKLKVGKKRPTNTNATDTSFSAKSIVFKQQSVSSGPRDTNALFNHNLSLLASKNETQRRDALQYLTTACMLAQNEEGEGLPQPASAVVAKAQALILDGNGGVRSQLLKLLKSLPVDEIGSLDQLLLYARAGMTHLSTDVRLFSLEVMDWILSSPSLGEAVMSVPGAWVKTLRTFENLLGWRSTSGSQHGNGTKQDGEKWTRQIASKTSSSGLEKGGNKLLVHQLTTLSSFLAVGLTPAPADPEASAKRAAQIFPLWHTDAHLLSTKSNPFGHLNLFGAPRDAESEVYDSAEERLEVFLELGFLLTFRNGTQEAKGEGGEIGRAAAAVDKALKLAETG
ncbi:hypothetical protein KC333_g5458 [Hortaea werneckii]|nr:hypothetical protein KC333_g5458 [Hortaea werneckii]KAI7323972.1 hypothetical protein KC326_g1255 [Hortaea werneckii]